MNKKLLILPLLAGALSCHAQNDMRASAQAYNESKEENSAFLKSLKGSVSVGTTGIGVDFSTPIHKNVRLRMGATFMPHFDKELPFTIITGQYKWDHSLSLEENNKLQAQFWKDNFLKLSDKLKGFTGITMTDNKLYVDVTPNFNNFKFLVDFYPFNNKKWHVTTGFYWGNNRVASAFPQATSVTPFLAVSMFNNLYKKSVGFSPIISVGGQGITMDESIAAQLQTYGLMQVSAGQAAHDIIANEDIYWDYTEYNLDSNSPQYYELMHEGYQDVVNSTPEGQEPDLERAIRYHKGDVIVKQDEWYRMTTDENGMITASAKANSFKPYIGGGYETQIDKSGRTSIAIDGGILFWGGMPEITTRNPLGVDKNGKVVYDKVDFSRDLYNVPNTIRPYVNFFKALKVFPVAEVRIVQTIF